MLQYLENQKYRSKKIKGIKLQFKHFFFIQICYCSEEFFLKKACITKTACYICLCAQLFSLLSFWIANIQAIKLIVILNSSQSFGLFSFNSLFQLISLTSVDSNMPLTQSILMLQSYVSKYVVKFLAQGLTHSRIVNK